MNLRRILGTHIILACVLSVHAFPIVLADDGSTAVNAHVYDSVPDFLPLGDFEVSGSYDSPVQNEVYPFDRRALSPVKAQPENPKKTASAQALAPVSPPKGKPAVPAPVAPNRKPSSPAPAPLPNKQSTSLPAAGNRNPPSRPLVNSPQRPGAAPSRPHLPGAPLQQRPPAIIPTCRYRRRDDMLSKRFNVNADHDCLTLGGATRPLVKLRRQGRSTITYQVFGGWPDPYLHGQPTLAFAKTGINPANTLLTEATWLSKVGQLLAHGQYEGRYFIVIRGANGVHFHSTEYYRNYVLNLLRAGRTDLCQAEVRRTIVPLVIQKTMEHVQRHALLHADISVGNVVSDQRYNPMSVTIIDWGLAQEQARSSDRCQISQPIGSTMCAPALFSGVIRQRP